MRDLRPRECARNNSSNGHSSGRRNRQLRMMIIYGVIFIAFKLKNFFTYFLLTIIRLVHKKLAGFYLKAESRIFQVY